MENKRREWFKERVVSSTKVAERACKKGLNFFLLCGHSFREVG